MSIEIDPQEVLEHLFSLGFYNITKEQLKDFVKDLKKLIKYDIRKLEREYKLTQENCHRPNKENDISPLPAPCNEDNNLSTKSALTDNIKKKSHCSCHFPQNTVKFAKKKPLGKKENAFDINHQNTQTERPVCSNCHQPISDKQLYTVVPSGANVDESEAETTSEYVQCLQTVEKKLKECDAAVKKQPGALKPCPSFIRPTSSKGKPPKADPVALYHYYKNLWSRHTLPGENSHEDLRWRIRHKMMAPPVVSKNPSEEKVDKKPEWVAS